MEVNRKMPIFAPCITELQRATCLLWDTRPTIGLWASEQHRLIKYLSVEDQEAISRAEATGQWDDPAYLQANDHYFEKYVISVDEHSPECIRRPKRSGTEAYLYGWGPNENHPCAER